MKYHFLRPLRRFVGPLALCFGAFLYANEANAFVRTLLDKETAGCISCHSEAVSEGPPLQVCHKGGCGHPIGVDYTEAYSKDPTLAKPETLDKALRLIDNKISCVTCHAPFTDKESHLKLFEERKSMLPSTPDPMLSVDNRASRLCTACHRK